MVSFPNCIAFQGVSVSLFPPPHKSCSQRGWGARKEKKNMADSWGTISCPSSSKHKLLITKKRTQLWLKEKEKVWKPNIPRQKVQQIQIFWVMHVQNPASSISSLCCRAQKVTKYNNSWSEIRINHQVTHEQGERKGLKMRYTTMDVGNIFKSLFGIYKTTKLLMQHHNCLHTHTHTQARNQIQTIYAQSFFLFSYSKKTGTEVKVKTVGLNRVSVHEGMSKWSLCSREAEEGASPYRAEIQQVAQLLVRPQSCHPLLMMHFSKITRTYKHGHSRDG